MILAIGLLVGKTTYAIGRDEDGFFCERLDEEVSGFGVNFVVGKTVPVDGFLKKE